MERPPQPDRIPNQDGLESKRRGEEGLAEALRDIASQLESLDPSGVTPEVIKNINAKVDIIIGAFIAYMGLNLTELGLVLMEGMSDKVAMNWDSFPIDENNLVILIGVLAGSAFAGPGMYLLVKGFSRVLKALKHILQYSK